MSFILKLLGGAAGPYIAGAVGGLFLLMAGALGIQTWRIDHMKAAQTTSALKASQGVTKAVTAQATINSTVDQKALGAISKTHTDTAALLQKVPTYVSRKADDQCIIGVGAVQLLDAAGSSSVPAAPSGLPDADSGVALSSLVSDTVVNAGSYRQAVTKGSSWDDWYDAQNPAWRKEHPAP